MQAFENAQREIDEEQAEVVAREAVLLAKNLQHRPGERQILGRGNSRLCGGHFCDNLRPGDANVFVDFATERKQDNIKNGQSYARLPVAKKELAAQPNG